MKALQSPSWHPRMRRLILAAMLLIVSAHALGEVEEHGAMFERNVISHDRSLQLTGTGVARYRIIFTVYAAGLYLPSSTPATAILAADTPRRLAIEYFHTISADDIILAANTKLQAQLGTAELERLSPKIEQFHGLYAGVEAGDRYRMDYQPGLGTELSFNGEPVGRVTGSDFAAAYFGIWLDAQDPLSQSLRDDLLANIGD